MIGYAGLSHLGLVSAAAAAAQGFETIGFDPDAPLVDRIRAGDIPIVEPGFDELLARGEGRLTLTASASELARCDVVFIAIDVPTDDAGRSDTTAVEDLLSRIPPVDHELSVVILSQVEPGFTRAHRQTLEVATHARLFYQVETLIFGRAVERAIRPERFMVGLAESGDPMPEPWRRFLESFDCPILPMRYESAELAKIAINFFLVSSISTTNLLAEVCERIGADWGEIAPALRLDARIGPKAYLEPGLGLGGGNLGRDLATVQRLAGQRGSDARLIDAWQANSTYRRDWALRVLHREVLSESSDVRLALWGVAYKQDTGSTKNSPALALARGVAGTPVRAYDPAARVPEGFPHVEQVDSALVACENADALLIMTPWSEFRRTPAAAVAAALRGRVVIDPYRVLDRDDAQRAGLRVHCLGAPEAA